MGAHRNTPQVRGGVLFVRTDTGDNEERIIVGGDRWEEWLDENHHFSFINDVGKFTARKDRRRNTYYWYAYRKINGKLKNKYLGKSDKLTDQKLYDTAKSFGL